VNLKQGAELRVGAVLGAKAGEPLQYITALKNIGAAGRGVGRLFMRAAAAGAPL